MIGTDFHSHILPGMDDGSASVEMSLELLRREKAQGIVRVAATPHFDAWDEHPEAFLLRRDRAEQQLRRAMAEEASLPELLIGAEVRYFRGIAEAQWLPLMTIRGTDSILLELPPPPWRDTIAGELRFIREQRGLIPVVAHIDRYTGPLRNRNLPRKLRELPVLVQANAEFFLKPSTAGMALKLLKADRIQLLGSDCHDLTVRKPNLGEAVSRIGNKLGQGVLENLHHYEILALSARKRGMEENL